jgi:hypothetical protein
MGQSQHNSHDAYGSFPVRVSSNLQGGAAQRSPVIPWQDDTDVVQASPPDCGVQRCLEVTNPALECSPWTDPNESPQKQEAAEVACVQQACYGILTQLAWPKHVLHGMFCVQLAAASRICQASCLLGQQTALPPTAILWANQHHKRC